MEDKIIQRNTRLWRQNPDGSGLVFVHRQGRPRFLHLNQEGLRNFLNVSGKETKEFLWVTVALVVVAFAGSAQVNSWETQVKIIGPWLKGIFDSILALVVPASIVVALKEVWQLAKGTA